MLKDIFVHIRQKHRQAELRFIGHMLSAMQHAANGASSFAIPIDALNELVQALMLFHALNDGGFQTGFSKE
jgi:hypothetical protein